MKLIGALTRLWCLCILLLIAACCHQSAGREAIVYRSDRKYWVMDPDGSNPQIIFEDIAALDTHWSPSGRQIAYVDYEGAIWVARPDGSEQRQITEGLENVGIAAWLNDHMLLIGVWTDVVDRYSNVYYVLDIKDGSMQAYSEGIENAVPFPSGDRRVVRNVLTGLTLYGLDQAPQLLPLHFRVDYGGFGVSPSGEEIIACGSYYVDDRTELRALFHWAIEDEIEEPTQIYTFTLETCRPINWAPVGERIAWVDPDDTLSVFNVSTSEIEYSYEVGSLSSERLTWSPGGDAILVHKSYETSSSGSSELACVDIKTGAITRLTNNDFVEYDVTWMTIR
jgi:hypothetical protein